MTPATFRVLLEADAIGFGTDPLPLSALGIMKRNRNTATKTLAKQGYLTDAGAITVEGRAFVVKNLIPLEWGEKCPTRDPKGTMATMLGTNGRGYHYGTIWQATQSADKLTTYFYKVGALDTPAIAVRTASIPHPCLAQYGLTAPTLEVV